MRITPALLLLFAAPAFAANYATCILDKMPGSQNDVAASAVARVCSSEFPGGNQAVAQGSGRGMFGFKSGAGSPHITPLRNIPASASKNIPTPRLFAAAN